MAAGKTASFLLQGMVTCSPFVFKSSFLALHMLLGALKSHLVELLLPSVQYLQKKEVEL